VRPPLLEFKLTDTPAPVLDDPSKYMRNPDAFVVLGHLSHSGMNVLLYEPTASSLTSARTFCWQQMITIVAEVDAIAKDPNIARRLGNPPYQSPDIFRARLPVAKKSDNDAHLLKFTANRGED